MPIANYAVLRSAKKGTEMSLVIRMCGIVGYCIVSYRIALTNGYCASLASIMTGCRCGRETAVTWVADTDRRTTRRRRRQVKTTHVNRASSHSTNVSVVAVGSSRTVIRFADSSSFIATQMSGRAKTVIADFPTIVDRPRAPAPKVSSKVWRLTFVMMDIFVTCLRMNSYFV